MEAKLDQISTQLDQHDGQFAAIITTLERNDEQSASIMTKLDRYDLQFAIIDRRFNQTIETIGEGFRQMNRRHDQQDAQFEDFEDRFDKIDMAVERLDLRLKKAEHGR